GWTGLICYDFQNLSSPIAMTEITRDPAFWPTWIGAVGSVLLAILAVFQDRIRGWLARPQLELEVQVAPPFCHKTSWAHPLPSNHPSFSLANAEFLPCYYFRLGVTNK